MRLFCILFAATGAFAQDAAELMAKMTANVEQATDARRLYVYEQKVRSSLVRAGGQISRWEKRTYTVLPTPSAVEKKMTSFSGEYRNGKKMCPYTEPGFKYKDLDIDGDLLSDLTKDLVDDPKSRDGIPHSLFPLRTADLKSYKFASKGETTIKGRRTFVIDFNPATSQDVCVHIGDGDDDCDSKPWKGTVWIDAEELQPARIQSELAYKVPWGVRVFLGTNLSQTGFSLAYDRVAENVWFPVTYGTEFRLAVLWGYKRTITLSLESSGFRKADVNSNITYEPSPAQ
jgi:hypothetical protein